jgi:hypothetical protein
MSDDPGPDVVSEESFEYVLILGQRVDAEDGIAHSLHVQHDLVIQARIVCARLTGPRAPPILPQAVQ